jgi:hypothetical protein
MMAAGSQAVVYARAGPSHPGASVRLIDMIITERALFIV